MRKPRLLNRRPLAAAPPLLNPDEVPIPISWQEVIVHTIEIRHHLKRPDMGGRVIAPIGNSALAGRRSAYTIPAGESPTGTGGSPALPRQIGTLPGRQTI
jgi:hypothetical protein